MIEHRPKKGPISYGGRETGAPADGMLRFPRLDNAPIDAVRLLMQSRSLLAEQAAENGNGHLSDFADAMHVEPIEPDLDARPHIGQDALSGARVARSSPAATTTWRRAYFAWPPWPPVCWRNAMER